MKIIYHIRFLHGYVIIPTIPAKMNIKQIFHTQKSACFATLCYPQKFLHALYPTNPVTRQSDVQFHDLPNYMLIFNIRSIIPLLSNIDYLYFNSFFWNMALASLPKICTLTRTSCFSGYSSRTFPVIPAKTPDSIST